MFFYFKGMEYNSWLNIRRKKKEYIYGDSLCEFYNYGYIDVYYFFFVIF